MPGVLINLPVYFDISLFFNCNGVVGRKGHSRLLPFSSLMSTLGSVLIESCRNIFTTVQRNRGYRVKLVSLYNEDLWGGERTQYNLLGEGPFVDLTSYTQPKWPVCFPSLSALLGKFALNLLAGVKKTGRCLCMWSLFPVCEP